MKAKEAVKDYIRSLLSPRSKAFIGAALAELYSGPASCWIYSGEGDPAGDIWLELAGYPDEETIKTLRDDGYQEFSWNELLKEIKKILDEYDIGTFYVTEDEEVLAKEPQGSYEDCECSCGHHHDRYEDPYPYQSVDGKAALLGELAGYV